MDDEAVIVGGTNHSHATKVRGGGGMCDGGVMRPSLWAAPTKQSHATKVEMGKYVYWWRGKSRWGRRAT